ncbi:MAG: CRISPR-associated endonuclease Cas6 [Bacteroidia bacterium]|nr:CRISPR-associated endonuclease Cas6 [Bacteroidia bacterium]
MNTSPLQTLSLRYSIPLRPHQLPQWRGAVAEAAGWENDLFHNHAETETTAVPVLAGIEKQSPVISTQHDVFVYRYPLIHYRVADRQAAIWSVNEGAAAARRWALQSPREISVGGQVFPLLIAGFEEKIHNLGMSPRMLGYRIMDYIPFSQENYRRWMESEDLTTRVALLEEVLTGHILGFATAMSYRLPERLEVRLLNIRETRTVRLHGNSLLGFNLLFNANIHLPDDMALGRGVSHGFGVMRGI